MSASAMNGHLCTQSIDVVEQLWLGRDETVRFRMVRVGKHLVGSQFNTRRSDEVSGLTRSGLSFGSASTCSIAAT
jgi:hypothetical protein